MNGNCNLCLVLFGILNYSNWNSLFWIFFCFWLIHDVVITKAKEQNTKPRNRKYFHLLNDRSENARIEYLIANISWRSLWSFASSQLTRIIIQHRSHFINEINSSDDDFKGSLNIACRGWFIPMGIDSKCSGRKKKNKKSYKLGKLMCFSKEYEYINKLTMSPKSMNMNNDQRWLQKMEKPRDSFVSRFDFCSVFIVLCCYICCYFSLISFVSFLRESFILKCQTYLPVKYLIYSSVYFNFDLVRAFHFNLISQSLHPPIPYSLSVPFVLNLNFLIGMECIWYQ